MQEQLKPIGTYFNKATFESLETFAHLSVVSIAEIMLWPYEPGVTEDVSTRELLGKLREELDKLSFEGIQTPAQLGRKLEAKVFISLLRFPREGWTYFENPPILEVADRFPIGLRRELRIAHEVCHLILGPISPRHDRPTERVCNWGAGEIIRRIQPAWEAGDNPQALEWKLQQLQNLQLSPKEMEEIFEFEH